MRPGTNIPVIYGMLWQHFQNGWEDKELSAQRVYGMDEIRKEARSGRLTRSSASLACRGAAQARRREVRQGEALDPDLGDGQTQHTTGRNVRASCILLLATGNVGGSAVAPTSSAATPTCRARLTSVSISRPSALLRPRRRCWKHWCRVWEVDYDWMLSRFESRR